MRFLLTELTKLGKFYFLASNFVFLAHQTKIYNKFYYILLYLNIVQIILSVLQGSAVYEVGPACSECGRDGCENGLNGLCL